MTPQNQTPTPRTDTLRNKCGSFDEFIVEYERLERELAEAKQLIEHLKHERNKAAMTERQEWMPIVAELKEQIKNLQTIIKAQELERMKG